MSSNMLDKKFEYWEHRLLDIGKRNRMINYRETSRSTLRITEPSFEELFRRIAVNEETLTFQRAVDRETDVRVYSILSLLETLSEPLPVTIGDIRAEGTPIERQRTLKNLRSKARLALEEQGTNILYLSFGFIEWKDGKGASAQWMRSPLILVPVQLSLDALSSPYKLSKYDDDIVLNPTLEYYLKNEYGIDLPHYDPDKTGPEEYLKSLEKIADKRGWRVLRDISLGLLSFLKITMYNDIKKNEDRIKQNPIIRAMAGDAEEVNDIPEELNSLDLDSISTRDCYQVMSADSSQQEAIQYSKNGVSFVMQGPPGTGKSQTITNIIAEALADGKKVLFVSEKMAALQVVYRRLQEAHLGDFCLPLHSYKANKKQILDQIGANLNLKQTEVKDNAMIDLEELFAIRKELNNYAEELHEKKPLLNISCYEAYGRLESVRSAPNVSFSFDDVLFVTQSDLQNYVNLLREYSLSVKRLHGAIKDNPWNGLRSRNAGYDYTEKMRSELSLIDKRLVSCIEALELVSEGCGKSERVNYSSLEDFFALVGKVCALPTVPEEWLYEFDIEDAKRTALDAEEHFKELRKSEKAAEQIFRSDIFDFDCEKWRADVDERAGKLFETKMLECDGVDFYAENCVALAESFAALKKDLETIESSLSVINRILGTSFTSRDADRETALRIYDALKDKAVICRNWFEVDNGILKNSLYRAKSKSADVEDCRSRVLGEWDTDVISKEYADRFFSGLADSPSFSKEMRTWKRELSKKAEEILSLPVQPRIGSMSADEITDGRRSLLENFRRMKDDADVITRSFEEINNILGTHFPASVDSAYTVSQLTDILKLNSLIPKKWLSPSFNDIRRLLGDAISKHGKMHALREKILADWENDAFSIDCKAMLTRYKTDYTGAAKIFSKQYAADRRLIQTISRSPGTRKPSLFSQTSRITESLSSGL